MTLQESQQNAAVLIAVGSKNPVKVGAVRAVVERVIAQGLMPGAVSATVTGIDVDSGVSAQPVGDEETRRGALSRAKAALQAVPGATHGVGLEGGIIRLEAEIYTCAWCVITDWRGNVSAGSGLVMPLPPPIVRDLDAGYELGDATDHLFAVKNSKHAGGALGFLSKGLRNRQDAYESIFTYALTKFLDPELYELR